MNAIKVVKLGKQSGCVDDDRVIKELFSAAIDEWETQRNKKDEDK